MRHDQPKARRARLIVEMGLLYIVAPLLVAATVHWMHVPVIVLIVPIFLLVVLLLSLDNRFSWRPLLGTAPSGAQLVQILALFAPLGAAIIAVVYFRFPEDFLSLPRQRPGLWLAIMIFYPLVSVTAQEIMFRVVFLHRYGALFDGGTPYAVLVNAALFAFAHIVFENWLTIVISFAGGLIFAHRYFSTRCYWAVVVEHSLYGTLIFTVGLGSYFLTGVPFA